MLPFNFFISDFTPPRDHLFRPSRRQLIGQQMARTTRRLSFPYLMPFMQAVCSKLLAALAAAAVAELLNDSHYALEQLFALLKLSLPPKLNCKILPEQRTLHKMSLIIRRSLIPSRKYTFSLNKWVEC